jgi:ubiquinone/menaquinone biosynthesis C-methylase UbiE
MRRVDYTEANRAAWNEAAPIHGRINQQRLIEGFRRPGFSVLKRLEQQRLVEEVGLEGKDVAQICCNNGREILSIKNLGAGRCAGFDISDEFIAQARELAFAAGLECEFVCISAYEIAHEFDGSFDLVYISIGALCWMPDLDGFFAVVARLLRQNGQLFIYEMHPFLDMLEVPPADPLRLQHSYFKADPFVDTDGLDYYGKTSYAAKPAYSFHHKLSDIIGGVLGNGMRLISFDEYAHDISSVFVHLESEEVRPPMCYILRAEKSGD